MPFWSVTSSLPVFTTAPLAEEERRVSQLLMRSKGGCHAQSLARARHSLQPLSVAPSERQRNTRLGVVQRQRLAEASAGARDDE